jgi:ATP-dependent Zn protease
MVPSKKPDLLVSLQILLFFLFLIFIIKVSFSKIQGERTSGSEKGVGKSAEEQIFFEIYGVFFKNRPFEKPLLGTGFENPDYWE